MICVCFLIRNLFFVIQYWCFMFKFWFINQRFFLYQSKFPIELINLIFLTFYCLKIWSADSPLFDSERKSFQRFFFSQIFVILQYYVSTRDKRRFWFSMISRGNPLILSFSNAIGRRREIYFAQWDLAICI